jgi:threonine-phosphate decarboxylase
MCACAEVYGAAEESGFRIEEILDFSSSVNPLGPSKKALEAITVLSAN